VVLQPNSGLRRLIVEVSRPHTDTHMVGLRRKCDQSIAEAATCTSTTNQQTQETNIHDHSGIRTCDPSKQGAADLRLRPHDHRDQPSSKWAQVILMFPVPLKQTNEK